ncbi:MAG: hypothetical protein AVDCRST_MAG08-4145, partial [uncultured Acetobacteraceae bacterium]
TGRRRRRPCACRWTRGCPPRRLRWTGNRAKRWCGSPPRSPWPATKRASPPCATAWRTGWGKGRTRRPSCASSRSRGPRRRPRGCKPVRRRA